MKKILTSISLCLAALAVNAQAWPDKLGMATEAWVSAIQNGSR